MSLEEALKLITESKQYLEAYKVYGQLVSEAIAVLNKIERLITERAYEEAHKLSSGLCQQISAYKDYVPDLASKLDKITEILGRNC
jgi:hypothetical protein